MTSMIKRIVGRWSASGIVEKADEDVYEYGLELILFSVVNLAAILATAAFFGKLAQSAALLIAIIPLQAYGGGYHAKTHMRCFLIMYIGWWAAMLALPRISPAAATAVAIASLPVVFLLAPVPHVNVEMSVGHRLKLRRFARIAASCIALLSVALIWLAPGISSVGIALSAGLGIAALSMLAAHCSNVFKAKGPA